MTKDEAILMPWCLCHAVLRGAAINAGWVRQLVATPDGGQFALDWWQGEVSTNVPPETPIVLVLHGVTGE